MQQFPEGAIKIVTGRGLPLRGDNVDTDHIFPARFLKELTFEKAAEHLFIDERFAPDGTSKNHPVDDKRYEGARILVGNANFGCGSGRGQAAQAIMRHGFRALVGESFAEIFMTTCTMIGIPCVLVSRGNVETLQRFVEENPEAELKVDLEQKEVSAGPNRFPLSMPEGYRNMLVTNTWRITELLLEKLPEVRAKAKTMPYLNGFR